MVAGKDDKVAAGVEEDGKGGEEVGTPGGCSEGGEGALDEVGGVGHVEGGGARVELEEVDAVAGDDEGGVGCDMGADEGRELGALVEAVQGAGGGEGGGRRRRGGGWSWGGRLGEGGVGVFSGGFELDFVKGQDCGELRFMSEQITQRQRCHGVEFGILRGKLSREVSRIGILDRARDGPAQHESSHGGRLVTKMI